MDGLDLVKEFGLVGIPIFAVAVCQMQGWKMKCGSGELRIIVGKLEISFPRARKKILLEDAAKNNDSVFALLREQRIHEILMLVSTGFGYQFLAAMVVLILGFLATKFFGQGLDLAIPPKSEQGWVLLVVAVGVSGILIWALIKTHSYVRRIDLELAKYKDR